MDLENHPVPVQGSLLLRDEDSFGNSGNRGSVVTERERTVETRANQVGGT